MCLVWCDDCFSRCASECRFLLIHHQVKKTFHTHTQTQGWIQAGPWETRVKMRMKLKKRRVRVKRTHDERGKKKKSKVQGSQYDVAIFFFFFFDVFGPCLMSFDSFVYPSSTSFHSTTSSSRRISE